MYVKFSYSIIIILLLLNIASTDNNNDSFRLIAAKEFQKEANFFNIDFDTTYKYTILDDTLESPFKQVHFLLYRFSKIEPNSNVIVYSLKEKINILNNSIDSVSDELNLLLLNEEIFTNNDLLKLVNLIIKIQSPIHNMVHLIYSWKDVPLKDDEKFPDKFKTKIIPPRVINKNNQKVIEYFNWYAGSAELYRTTIIYSEKKIFIKNMKLLNIGPIFIIL